MRGIGFLMVITAHIPSVRLFGYLQGPLKQSADGIARFCDRMAGLAAANTGSGDDKTWQMQATLLLTHGLSLFAAAGAPSGGNAVTWP